MSRSADPSGGEQPHEPDYKFTVPMAAFVHACRKDFVFWSRDDMYTGKVMEGDFHCRTKDSQYRAPIHSLREELSLQTARERTAGGEMWRTVGDVVPKGT